jgi:hypothetical protein
MKPNEELMISLIVICDSELLFNIPGIIAINVNTKINNRIE